MSALSKLMASPFAQIAHFRHPSQGPLTPDSFGELPVFEWEGRQTTPVEIFNLITHLYARQDVANVVPKQWRDEIFFVLLRNALDHGSSVAELTLAESMAGPKCVPLLRKFLDGPTNHGFYLNSFCRALWNLEGLSCLPLLVQALGPRGVYYRDQSLAFLDAERKLGIGAAAWDLLWVSEQALAPDRLKKTRRESATQLAGYMERNIRFGSTDLKLLAKHPAHWENLFGLVFAVYSADDKLQRTFILPDPLELAPGETIAIAHPAALDAAEIVRWKSAFFKEERKTPFDQWKGADAAGVALGDISIEPCNLLLALESKGWIRGRADASGVIRRHHKIFADTHTRAEIEYTGVPTTYGSHWAPQTIERCTFFREPSGVLLTDSETSPIVRNAVMADLVALKEKTK